HKSARTVLSSRSLHDALPIWVILAKQGGALPRMALPFRLGLGGRIGSGRQWISWVTLEDIVGIIRFALETNLLSGPANAVSPNPDRKSTRLNSSHVAISYAGF